MKNTDLAVWNSKNDDHPLIIEVKSDSSFRSKVQASAINFYVKYAAPALFQQLGSVIECIHSSMPGHSHEAESADTTRYYTSQE